MYLDIGYNPMKLFSNCSGPCETCLYFHLKVNCLAGHGDDHYTGVTPEEIETIKNGSREVF